MKNLIIIAIALFSLNVIAQEKKEKIVVEAKNAQQIEAKEKSPEMIASYETKKMTKRLSLTPEQQTKVYDVLLAHTKDKMSDQQKTKKVIAAKDKTSKAELKQIISEQREIQSQKLDNELKKLLTEAQYKDYLQNKLQKRKANQKVMVKKN